MSNSLMLHAGGKKIDRQNLSLIETPESTSDSHVILSHEDLVRRVEEALGYRGITIKKDEYAIAKNGLRLFGMLTLSIEQNGINLVMGLRNSHDKSFSLGIVSGWRVFICDNLAFYGEFEALTKKHSKNMLADLDEKIIIGVHRTQKQFAPMMERVERWQDFSLTDSAAKDIIYRAFVQKELDAPENLAKKIHNEYFEPRHEEFRPRTLWSLQNAFTQIFGDELDPMPQYKALASLDEFFPAPERKVIVPVPSDIVVEAVTV